MKEISQLLAIYTNDHGAPTRGADKQEVSDLYARLWQEFWASQIGKQIISRGGPNIGQRVFEIFESRYENAPPNKVGYFEALEEIGRDLLVVLPAPVTPVEQPKPKVNLEPEFTQEQLQQQEIDKKHDSKIRQFAHMANEQMNRDPVNGIRCGIGSLKPRAGIVTLEIKGNLYEYPAAEFEALFSEAQAKGLLR